ncbi:MAG: NADH-quinone oxidoreductase subunit J [Chloroflexi bacterium]|nr:NADH-quinone oxidoreductase subunit J [Chloroflexota bacterium]
MALDIAFWILAVVSVFAALAVVLLRNIFRAALSMMVCFLMVAGLYATLGADLLAVVQVIIYIGAISILIILSIMFTRDVWQASSSSVVGLPAIVASVLFGGVVIFLTLNSRWQTAAPAAPQPTTSSLGASLFGQAGYALPLEISAGLLLAAVIGAMVLVREK